MEVSLLMPFSHQLPIYRRRHANYDRMPGILAAYIRTLQGQLTMVDVGANIGDTIISTLPQSSDFYLALEPHPDFFPYLLANTSRLSNVTCLQIACGEGVGELSFGAGKRGTAGFSRSVESVYKVEMDRLDAICQRVWNVHSVNFIKIDTDGFDVPVLLGALELLRGQHPWLLYECDVAMTAHGASRHLEILQLMNDLGYCHMICYDNLGNCLGVYQLGDLSMFRPLLEQQSPQGPIWYHDILLVPPSQSAAAFLQYAAKLN
jgi:FkbM family methyltransferase